MTIHPDQVCFGIQSLQVDDVAAGEYFAQPNKCKAVMEALQMQCGWKHWRNPRLGRPEQAIGRELNGYGGRR